MYTKVAILFVALVHFDLSLQDPLVDIPNGQIQGREDSTSEDKAYYAFEKIPYAAPPVGDLRFEPPQPVENWDGVLNTTQLDVSCYQLGGMKRMPGPGGAQSEDCLFLNVFTPKLPSEEDEELLPVMVFIHGGGFTGGSAMNNPPDLFINNDVILVTINYRLGVFGFISTQDEVIPGNNGLKDQRFALQWVHDNIELFGGDPDQVTIFGQSAGAGSCAHQALNLNSEGLFSGVILESGTFLCTGMFQRNSRTIAFGTGAVLDSTFETSEDSEALLELLRSVDADDLNEAAQTYDSSSRNSWDSFLEVGVLFAPVIEAENPDAFLTEKMYGLLKAGKILPVPTLMGFTGEEKSIGEESAKPIAAVLDENLAIAVPVDIPDSESVDRAELGSTIRDIYTDGEPFADHLGAVIRFGSDNFLGRSMTKHAELLSNVADTYFYQFSFSGELDSMGGPPGGRALDDAGNVGHGSDLAYLFCSGESCTDSSIAEADLLTRQRMIKLWTNFAKYRNPTPETRDLFQNITWPKVSTKDGDFYYLDILEDLEVKNHPKEESYSKWVEIYESVNYDDYDTY